MKITFSSPLASLLRSYITLKQAQGRKYAHEARVLFSIDRLLADPKSRDHDLTSETFYRWSQKQEKLKPGVRRAYMRIVRNFCLYHRRSEPHCFVPDLTLFPRPHQPVHPYIFSPTEIQRLLDQCSRFKPARYSPLRPQLFRLVVVLLFTIGLRRGELLHLTLGDYDSHEHTLLIRASKFHKSRLLPLPDDVRREIDHYLEARRRRSLPMSSDTPLVWNNFAGGRAYTPESLRYGLEQLLKREKIQAPSGRLPRTDDWRHSFAVNALVRWYRQGMDVQAKLPFLAAYMGHVSPLSTYYYLHFVEPLRTLASRRFAKHYGRLVSLFSGPKGDAQ
jgi:integrase/recombinase XerD